MTSDATRDEFKQLEARVDVVEREVDGEKLVSRHILQETRRNSSDLAAIKSRLDRHDERFDTLDQKFDGLERKVDVLSGTVNGFKRSLPQMVADVMREVLRERDAKKEPGK